MKGRNEERQVRSWGASLEGDNQLYGKRVTQVGEKITTEKKKSKGSWMTVWRDVGFK